MLFACGESDPETDRTHDEAIMTEYSESLSIIESQNGRRSYHFETPLVEGYGQAREPYREFRRGLKITTFKDDSLSSVDARLTADYAIRYETRKLWEAKGNVVVAKSDGKTLYTQQLFWNERTKRIYSNVDSKIVQNDGRDVFIGEGFESDESFSDWRFRRMKGRMEVEVKQPADSAGRASSAGEAAEVRPDGRSGHSAEVSGRAAGTSGRTENRADKPARPAVPRPAKERPAAADDRTPATRRPAGDASPAARETGPALRTAAPALLESSDDARFSVSETEDPRFQQAD